MAQNSDARRSCVVTGARSSTGKVVHTEPEMQHEVPDRHTERTLEEMVSLVKFIKEIDKPEMLPTYCQHIYCLLLSSQHKTHCYQESRRSLASEYFLASETLGSDYCSDYGLTANC